MLCSVSSGCGSPRRWLLLRCSVVVLLSSLLLLSLLLLLVVVAMLLVPVAVAAGAPFVIAATAATVAAGLGLLLPPPLLLPLLLLLLLLLMSRALRLQSSRGWESGEAIVDTIIGSRYTLSTLCGVNSLPRQTSMWFLGMSTHSPWSSSVPESSLLLLLMK